jgi:hypothetical protein
MQKPNTKLTSVELELFHEVHVHRSNTSEIEVVKVTGRIANAVEIIKDRIGANDPVIIGLELYSVMPLQDVPGWANRKLIQEWSRT